MQFEIYIDGQKFFSNEQFITGRTIRKIANIPSKTALSFKVNRTDRFILVADNDSIDLGHPDSEEFYTESSVYQTNSIDL